MNAAMMEVNPNQHLAGGRNTKLATSRANSLTKLQTETKPVKRCRRILMALRNALVTLVNARGVVLAAKRLDSMTSITRHE
jgi:hypothetical protein